MRIVVESTELVAREKCGVYTARLGIVLGLLEHLKSHDELVLTHWPIGNLPELPAAASGATVTEIAGPSWYPYLKPFVAVARRLGWPLKWLRRGRGVVEKIQRATVHRLQTTPFVQKLERDKKPDLFFSSELDYYRLPNAKNCAFLHDLLPLMNPEWFIEANRRNYQRKIDHLVNDCDIVLTNSERTRQDALEYLPLNEAQYFVTPLAAHPSFRPKKANETFDDLDEKYGLKDRRVVLYIGTIEPRKNLLRLMNAIDRLQDEPSFSDVLFVMGGNVGWHCEDILERAKEMEGQSRLLRPGYIDQETLVRLYRRAELFAFVSEYEGFGLPAIEAMQSGTALLASTGGALPEVIGSAAPLIDPESESEIHGALRWLMDSESTRNSFRAKGLERSQLFSWSATGKRVAEIFRWAAEGGERPSNSIDWSTYGREPKRQVA